MANASDDRYCIGQMNYVALLRGINVGGNAMIRMSELKTCLEKTGFADVRTFIQSGNVLFSAPKSGTPRLARNIEAAVEKTFRMKLGVAVFTAKEWHEVVRGAPKWWGKDKDWKHNLLALLPGTKTGDVIEAMGTLKPEIERAAAGPGVIYQSLSIAAFARTNGARIPGHSIYRRITVRNYNTTRKLGELLKESDE
jgi:uncharacterized protein (DUF1697 family)